MRFHTHTFEGIGVTNQVTVSDAAALGDAARIAHDLVTALDLACSRFRHDSELAALNRSAGRPVVVSDLLLEAVETALWAAISTDGLVDPTVGRAMRGIGYDRDFTVMVAAGPASFALVPAGGWTAIVVDHERRLGGDIAVRGAPAAGWPVPVTDDHRDAGALGQTVGVRGGGLATSRTTVRRWTVDGVARHHLVDPSTGTPALGPWRTVSVAAETCAAENTASTAAIVLGSAALPWLEARSAPARASGPGRNVGRLVT